jgi:F0F1-type ATP synthase assembly protein I
MPDEKGLGNSPYGGKRSSGALGGGEFAGIGLQFALAILAFTALGIWLDKHLGTTPWLLVLCVFLGAGGGFYSMYRKIIAAQRRDADARKARRAQKPSDERHNPGA